MSWTVAAIAAFIGTGTPNCAPGCDTWPLMKITSVRRPCAVLAYRDGVKLPLRGVEDRLSLPVTARR